MENYDFCGWATRNDLTCSDGRVIRRDAFKAQDGAKVPLVWAHQHNDSENVLGHAFLENRAEGVYAYGVFNDTPRGRNAKLMVQHGDITAMSIFANQLKQQGPNVLHGSIKELSLVLAGANPGAYIENVIQHGEYSDEQAIIYTGETLELHHAESVEDTTAQEGESASIEHADNSKEEKKMAEETKKPESEETVADVYNAMSQKQKDVVHFLVGQALEGDDTARDEEDSEGGNKEMKHNVFDNEVKQEEGVLSHDAMATIIGDAKRFGSMKESVLQHAATYGIDQIDYLIPDPKSLNTPPEFIKRDTGWVKDVMGAVHHTPFSRIKSMFADITEDEARAKGYMKGKLKKEEVFSLLKRSTTPTTIYKKQKMDRDDVIDITDFDVIAWLKSEMRMMLDEEIARAVLIGDGRLASDDDKINEQNIRPVWTDEELYTIKARFNVSASATDDDKAKAFIRAAIKARKNYKGSGNPVLYTTEDVLTDCLLLTDEMGRDLYESVEKLATKLRVSRIVTVPVMENLSREDAGTTYDLMGLIVNMADYNIGADKGGAINMFDDFDIDYNQMKYLIETRCSGALTKPHSAIALEVSVATEGI